MKRKIIKHSLTSHVLTLPKQWMDRNDLSKEDEVNLIERNNDLIISLNLKKISTKEINIDVTNLDRTTLMYSLRNLYREGYDKINIIFNNEKALNQRKDKSYYIVSIIHKEVNRLLGFEVIEESKNSCIVKNITDISSEDLNSIINRVYLLLLDLAEIVYSHIEEENIDFLSTIKVKEENIIRFINYALRLANKNYFDKKISLQEYYSIATLDRCMYLLSSSSKFLLYLKENNENIKNALKLTYESLQLLYKLKLSKKSNYLVEMNKKRYELENLINNINPDIEKENACINFKTQLSVLFSLKALHNLILDISNAIGV